MTFNSEEGFVFEIPETLCPPQAATGVGNSGTYS